MGLVVVVSISKRMNKISIFRPPFLLSVPPITNALIAKVFHGRLCPTLRDVKRKAGRGFEVESEPDTKAAVPQIAARGRLASNG